MTTGTTTGLMETREFKEEALIINVPITVIMTTEEGTMREVSISIITMIVTVTRTNTTTTVTSKASLEEAMATVMVVSTNNNLTYI